MKKALKIAGLCAAVLATVVIALLIWVATLDPNQHKDWIARQFEARTGRPLSLAGPLELSLYPWLGLAARDIGVGEANGSGEFFRAEQLALRVKLLPLLTGRYEIDTVRLHGAQLSLRVDEGGNDNWSDLAGPPEQEPAPSQDDGLSLANVVLGGVDIRDLGIDYEDRAQGLRYQLRSLDMSSGPLAFGDPIALQSSFEVLSSAPDLAAALNLDATLAYDDGGSRYDIAPLRLSGQLSGPNVPGGTAPLELTTSLQLDLAEETLNLPDLSLALLDMRLQAAVQGEEIQGADARFQASLDLVGSDLAVFFRILDNPELAQRISALASENFSLGARLALDGGAGSLQVEDLRGELLGATLSGELRGEGLNAERPRFEGRLDAAGPNLPALVEVAGQLQGADSDLAVFGRQLGQVPDKDFRVDTQFSIDPGNGVVQVPALELRLLGASIRGNLDASGVQGDSPRVQGALDASGPDLPLLLQVAGHWQGGAESFLNQFGRSLRQTLPARAFSLRSDFDADLRAGDIQVPTLQAELPGFTLSGSASGSGLSGNRGNLQGNLRLQGDGLSPVLRALDQPGLAEVARSLDLSLDVAGGRRDLRVNPQLSVVLAGDRIPQSPATLSLSADGALDLEADSLNLEALRLAGLGVDLQGSAAVEALSEAPRASGQLALQPLDLRALLTQLGLPLPAMADPATLRQVAFSGGFQASATALALEDLELRLDDSLLSGRASLATPDLPTMAFDLDLDRLDADRYLPPPSDEPAQGGDGEGSGELPVEQLRALALDGRLDVGELKLSGLRMQALSLQARAQQGRLQLRPALRLYEGDFTGELTLDAAPALPTLAVEAALDGIALGPLLQDALQASYLSGKGDLSLDLRSSGTDLSALKAGLQGQGRVDLAEGLLQGVDVAGVLAQLEAIIRSGRLVSVERGSSTAFETFAATLAVQGGVVSSSDLLLDADGFTVTGAGVLANLNDNSLDFDLSATVEETPTSVGDRQYDIGGYSLPIACGGSLNAPRCLPDTQAILSNALSTAVQRGLGDLLNRALGGDANAEPQPPAGEQSPAPAQPPADEGQQESDPRQDLLNRALEGLLR